MADEQLLESLDRDGYAVIRNVIPKELADDLRQWAEAIVDEDLEWRFAEVQRRREAGESDARAFPRGADGKFWLPVHDERSETLAASVASVVESLGTPVHGRLGISACMAGWGGHDGVHQELTGPASDVGTWDGATFTWPLTSPWRGRRLIPGSHRRDPVFQQRFGGAIAPHPDEVHPEVEPGDVLIYNLHIWKSGTLNQTSSLRCALSLTFRRDESVSAAMQARWEEAEIFDGGAPWDPGNAVQRDPTTR